MKYDYEQAVSEAAAAIVEELLGEDRDDLSSSIPRMVREELDTNYWIIHENAAIETLQYSKNPCAGFSAGIDVGSDKDGFPFSEFAAYAMKADVTEEVCRLLEERGVDSNEDKFRIEQLEDTEEGV